MRFTDYWVRTQGTPIPQREITDEMKRHHKNYSSDRSIVHALQGLCRMGYLRVSVITSNKKSYVQLRKI